MKKLLIACSIAILLSACKRVPDEDSVILTKKEYDILTQTKPSEYPKPFYIMDYDALNRDDDGGILMGSDGHEYVITRNGYDDESQSHYIDCKVCMARQQHLEDLLMEVIKNTTKDSIK